MRNEDFSQMLYKGATYRNEIAPYGEATKIGKFTGGYYPWEIHGLAGGMKKTIISTNPQHSSNKASTASPPTPTPTPPPHLYQTEEQQK